MRSRFHWNDFAEQLQKEIGCQKVYTVELPGNGELCHETSPASVAEALTLLQKQLPESLTSYGLIGISLGGMLASYWAQQRPTEVSHLVLINSSSSLSPFYHRLNPSHYLSILKSLISPSPEKTEEFILKVTSNDEKIWRPHLKRNIEFAKNHPVSASNFKRQLNLASQVNFKKVPSMPKMILTSEHDRLVSTKCSHRIAKAWGCTPQIHPTAGHDLTLDDPTWAIKQIKTFSRAL